MERVIAITGIPGSGKTTVAGFLARQFKRTLLTMHEIVEQIDPESLARGDMADAMLMRHAFAAKMVEYRDHELIIDGWPRSPDQAVLLPNGTTTILLNCRKDVARDRLLRRARPDDTPSLVEKRLTEQAALLGVDEKDGWVYKFVGWEGAINTTMRKPDDVCRSVFRYLIGEKRQAFDG